MPQPLKFTTYDGTSKIVVVVVVVVVVLLLLLLLLSLVKFM